MAELVEAIQSACDEKGQDSSSVLSELDAVVGEREVLSFCVSQGPLPNFPQTLVDVFLLTSSAIMNLEMVTSGGVNSAVVRLDQLNSIMTLAGTDDFVSFRFDTAGNFWGLERRRENEKDARDFVEAVRKQWLR